MPFATRVAAGLALALATVSCGLVDGLTGDNENTVELSEGSVTIDGISNRPTTAKLAAMSIETPIGLVTVETYDSEIGPCYDLVFGDGRREANCLRASGIDPDAAVTGRPDGSSQALNGPSWNAGLTQDRIGTFHHGLAHPTVRTVTIEPDGMDPIGFPVARAPNVDGLAFYVAWSPAGVERHGLAGYDAAGCLVEEETIDVQAGTDGGVLSECGRKLPAGLTTVQPETTS